MLKLQTQIDAIQQVSRGVRLYTRDVAVEISHQKMVEMAKKAAKTPARAKEDQGEQCEQGIKEKNEALNEIK